MHQETVPAHWASFTTIPSVFILFSSLIFGFESTQLARQVQQERAQVQVQ